MPTKKIKCPQCGHVETITGQSGESKKIICQKCNKTGIFQFPKETLKNNHGEQSAITVKGFSKTYNDLKAVDNITFSVKKGEIFGFLGPNGAGKTTTIKGILHLLIPDHGTISINNHNITTQGRLAKKQVGYLPEKVAFYENLTALQNLQFYAEMKKIPTSTAKPLLKEFGLADAINKKVGEFSKGMKQRLGMARAVLGNPPILILDEPSSGLDPRGVVFIREKIRKMKENGSTVFVSSHILNEIQEICDRVGIINKGRIVAEDTIANLGDTLQLKPKILIQLQNITDEIISSIKEIDGVSYVNQRHNYLEVICPPRIKAKVIVAVVKQGGNIINLQTREPSLEDVFMKFTEET